MLRKRLWHPTRCAPPGRACPAPGGVAYSLGASDRCNAPPTSLWHHVHGTLLRFPVGTMDHTTAKQRSVLGEVQHAYLLSRAPVDGSGSRTGLLAEAKASPHLRMA